MMLSQNTFTGEFTYSVDTKGRVNIPAKFRQCLSMENNNTFVITQGMDPCIWVYPLVVWNQIELDLKKLSSLSALNRHFIRNTVRFASSVEYDKQGRIQLTSSLVDYADIQRDATIIGMVNKIEIWNPTKLKEIVTDKDRKVDPAAYDELAKQIIL